MIQCRKLFGKAKNITEKFTSGMDGIKMILQLVRNEASSNNAHSLSVDTVTFLIMIQNALITIPVCCKWNDKYCTQIMTYSLVCWSLKKPLGST